jgi:phospholipid-translocating ATPase
MNASGVIESPSVINIENPTLERRRVVVNAAAPAPINDKYSRLSESRSVTPSPPLGKTTASLRPRLLDLNAPSSLSPICSSGENTPHGTPSPRPVRRLAGFLRGGRGNNKNSHVTPTPSSITPSPGEMKPIFEAESPDELALVDAAYTYNCRLLKRTPQHVTVNVPGKIQNNFLFNFNCSKIARNNKVGCLGFLEM